MNTSLRALGALFLVAALSMPAIAQFQITKNDLLNVITDALIVTTKDSTTKGRNFGDGTSGQNWDFSDLNLASSTLKKDSSNYRLPAGHAGASAFPTASACISQYGSQKVSGDTVLRTELAAYYEANDGGAYILGLAVHMWFSPARPPLYASFYPADTTVYSIYRPHGLGFPLPLFNSGVTSTGTDTLTEPALNKSSHPKTTITVHALTPAGDGTVKFPGGASKQVVRYVKDEIQTTYTDLGVFTGRKRNRQVVFYAKDISTISFDVDTTYTTGTATPKSFSYSAKVGPALGVSQQADRTPARFELEQNYPNPFNPSTVISFNIRTEGFVTLKVYNLLGQEVATLAEGKYAPGAYSVRFDASNLPSGAYLYTLSGDGASQTKPMLLIK